jgi:hypothetical protein
MRLLPGVLIVSLAGCGALSGESRVPAPPFPSMRVVDRVVVTAPRGLVEGQLIEQKEVPGEAARDLVNIIETKCTSWSGDAGGHALHTRPGYPVNVYFESVKGRLVRLGLSKGSVAHEAGQRHAYCDWDSGDYAQALKALGLR